MHITICVIKYLARVAIFAWTCLRPWPSSSWIHLGDGCHSIASWRRTRIADVWGPMNARTGASRVELAQKGSGCPRLSACRVRRKMHLARAGGSQGKRDGRDHRTGETPGIGGSHHCGHQVHPPGEQKDVIGLLGGRHVVAHAPSLRPRSSSSYGELDSTSCSFNHVLKLLHT